MKMRVIVDKKYLSDVYKVHDHKDGMFLVAVGKDGGLKIFEWVSKARCTLNENKEVFDLNFLKDYEQFKGKINGRIENIQDDYVNRCAQVQLQSEVVSKDHLSLLSKIGDYVFKTAELKATLKENIKRLTVIEDRLGISKKKKVEDDKKKDTKPNIKKCGPTINKKSGEKKV